MSTRPPRRRSPEPPASGPSAPHRPPDPPPINRVKVILHRTDGTGLLLVARAIRDLTRYGEAEATHRMWEVHHRGRSLILVAHRERAELYVEQFAERGLEATLEPV